SAETALLHFTGPTNPEMRLIVFFALLAIGCGALDVDGLMKLCESEELICNRDAIESIFVEEAKKIGITVDEHAKQCKKDYTSELTAVEQMIMKMEMMKVKKLGTYRVRFNTSSEVIPYIKKHLPSTYGLFEPRLASLKVVEAKLSKETRAYLEGVYALLLDSVVRVSQEDLSTKEKFAVAILREVVTFFQKAVDNYEKLPESVKTDLERHACVRTTYRTFSETGFIAKYKAMMDTLGAQ
ncbi:hypothetical protein PFISCL1PPCAC_5120, partial [Pristionchus fissidentatus]